MAACKLGTGGCYYMLFLLTSDTTKRVSCLKKVPQCPSLVLSPQYCTLPLFIYVLLILKVICLIQSIFKPPPFPLKLCIGGLVPLFSIEARNSPVSIISPLFQSL